VRSGCARWVCVFPSQFVQHCCWFGLAETELVEVDSWRAEPRHLSIIHVTLYSNYCNKVRDSSIVVPLACRVSFRDILIDITFDAANKHLDQCKV
jgi:hypothetical protein